MRLLLAAKTLVFLIFGLYITFAQSHTLATGLFAFQNFTGAYVIATVGVIVFVRNQIRVGHHLLLALLALIVGNLAMFLGNNDPAFWYPKMVAIWGLGSGTIELIQAYRSNYKTQIGRELSISGGLSAIFGLLFLLVPLAPVDSVGFFGAYLILSAVHLGISAASERKTA